MQPAELAAQVLGVEPGEIVSVVPIKHGLTNASWIVSTPVEEVVVRLSRGDAATLQIDRHSEAAILDAVARAGIGPVVLHCDPASGSLVTRYLGPTWSDADALRSENVVRVAQLLSQLHALELPERVHRLNLVEVLQGYLDALERQHRSELCGHPVERDRAFEIAHLLQSTHVPQLCHNDVHALNIIDVGSLRLIDWEYAGAGDPAFDLASICVYHGFDALQRRELLAAYTATLTPVTPARLDQACWLFDYVRKLWLAVQVDTQRSA